MSNNTTPSGPALQARDTQLFAGLLESRVMTREQLAKLYFDGNYDVAKKRLFKLTQAGFVRERKSRANPGRFFPSTLSLGRRGFDALNATPALLPIQGITWEQVADRIDLARSTLAHELELIDHRVAFTAALRGHASLALAEFLTWPALYQFKTVDCESGKELVLKADAQISVLEDDELEHTFFLEYDRSTEVGRQLAKKAFGYHHYYTTGGFSVRSGAPREDFKEHPFRVLYIVPSVERRNSIAERLLQVHNAPDRGARRPALLRNQHWLTTSAQFLAAPLGAIWLTLADYWHATEGTLYDPRSHFTRQRIPPRDRLVAERAELRSLFAQQEEVSHV